MTLRLFIAVDPGEALRSSLARTLDGLQQPQRPAGARWTRPGSWHLTLRFLGASAPALLPRLEAAMGQAAAGQAPFQATLGGLGAFPSSDRARVLYAGLGQGTGAMAELAHRLGPPVDALGYATEPRQYIPHLSLARFKRPSPVQALCDTWQPPQISFQVSELVLYRSELQPDGPRYEALTRVPLLFSHSDPP